MVKKFLCALLALCLLFTAGCSFGAKDGSFDIFSNIKTPHLTGLMTDRGDIEPGFDPTVFDYSIDVPNSCEQISVFPTASKNSEISIDEPKKLEVGQNSITVNVSDKSGDTAAYKITVTRLPSNECRLVRLSLGDSVRLSPEFSEDVSEYTAEVGYGVNKLDIDVQTDPTDAAVEISGNEEFKGGENRVEITITSPSGLYSSKYTINVVKDDTIPDWREAIEKGMDKFVAITFDDGPSKNTPKLLDILDKHGVKATFFVVGNRIDQFSDTLLDAHNRGHEIANHSWDHSYMRKSWSDDDKWENINRCNKKVKEITGQSPTSFRPPGGIWIKSVKKFHDMDVVYWSVDPEDWKYHDSDKVSKAILSNTKNHSIILLHDLYETSVDAADIVIEKLLDEGYIFVTVNEMVEIKAYLAKSGKAESSKSE